MSRKPLGKPPERYPVDGKMMTVAEIAQMLGVKAKTLYNWRYKHPGPYGEKAEMAEAVTYYRLVKAGARPPRGRPRRGRKPRRARAGTWENDREVVRAVNTIMEILGY